MLVLAVALAAGGCDTGDSGGGARAPKARPAERPATDADRKAIRAVLERLFRSGDVRAICERSLTPRLFRMIYARPAACRKAEGDDEEEDEKPTKRVEVRSVRTSGARATADISLVGGDASGSRGGVSLRRDAGAWRVDDLSIGFMRTVVTAVLRNEDDLPGATARCIDRRLMRMPEDRFKPFSLGLIGERQRPTTRLFHMWIECERGGKGITSLRRPVERTLRRQLRKAGADRTVEECVIRRLRSTLPDGRLIDFTVKDDRASKVQLNRELVAAAIACGFGPRSDPRERLSPA